MQVESIKVFPEEKYSYILIMSSDFLKTQINIDKIFDTNIIEKLEQEQIDDKYILRWTAMLDTFNIDKTDEPLQINDICKRAQSGLIYTPNVFGNTGLLVLFTDYNFLFSNPGLPPTVLTTAYLWYKNVQCEQNYIVAYTHEPVSQILFGLQDIVVPSMIMTNKYELPPLSVSKINQGIGLIKDAIVREHCLER